ncbi:MAG TPA: xanthine dehydrogenase family protein molybdopterin-binding subunit, partial [Candidatus Kryptonia bacterium]|nr:xanthine dehydrogenase family protein molybdopterin-binding subunit [Candidatus Kryptonia bacterium]
IDADAARGIGGVEAVLTANDLPRASLWYQRHPKLKVTRQPVLAFERVRFVGEPVAIVLAENRYAAADALERMDVAYDPILDRNTPLFDHIPDNVVLRDVQQWGDLDRAFATAAKIVTSTYHNARQLACPLEARGCIASYDPFSRELILWASTQVPHRLRNDLAAAIGIAESRIRVHMIDIGGGFGQKIPTHIEELAVALASMATGRPVRWVEDRQENLVAAPHSRDQTIHLELAVDEALRFTALRAALVSDAGAYSFNSGSATTEAGRASESLIGPYRIDAYGFDVKIMLTSKSPIAPYRGVGNVAAQCARELLIDKAARELGVDRFDLRERNMIRSADLPYKAVNGVTFRDTSFVETLTKARERLHQVLRQLGEPAKGALRGVGVSPFFERASAGPSIPSHDAARVTVDGTGRAVVVFGTPSIGQGIETTMAQVAADALGFKIDDVAVSWTDTTQAPVSLGGTRASRVAVVMSGAVGRAGESVRQQILDVAAVLLQANAAELSLHDGQIRIAGQSDPKMSAAEAVRIGLLRTGLPSGLEPTFEATKFFEPTSTVFSNACIIAVIAVAPETGEVRVERIIGVEDCGTMLNPMIVEGQFHGGVTQGIGMALKEEFVYDDHGQPFTGSFLDYALPIAGEGAEFDITHVVTPSSASWEGVKAVGEGGVIGGASAVIAAVADALAQRGVDVQRMPMTAEKTWLMLRSNRASREPR